jgi:hypothetical protein
MSAPMSHRDNDPVGSAEPIPGATVDALRPILDPGELIDQVLPAVGCSLVLTDRRLILVRDGASYRPRSGIHLWRLDRTLIVHTTPIVRGTGRIVIEGGGEATSVFVSAEGRAAADTLLREMHRRINATD